MLTTVEGSKLNIPPIVPMTLLLVTPLAVKALTTIDIGPVILTVQVSRTLYPLVSFVVITPPVI